MLLKKPLAFFPLSARWVKHQWKPSSFQMEENGALKREIDSGQVPAPNGSARTAEKHVGDVKAKEPSNAKAPQFQVIHVLMIGFLLWIW